VIELDRPAAIAAPERATAGVHPTEARRALLLAVDVVAAVAAVGLAGGTAHGALACLVAAVGVGVLDRRNTVRLSLSVLDDVPALAARGVAIAGVAAVLGLPVYGPWAPGARRGVGLLVTALMYTTVAVTGRATGYAVLRRRQASRRLSSPALIVGAGLTGARLGKALREHPEYGLAPVGFVDQMPAARLPSLPAPLLGDVTDLPKLIAAYGVRHVFVASCRTRDEDLVDVLRDCDRLDCEIFVIPRLFELGVAGAPAAEHLWGLPVTRLPRTPYRSHSWPLKRLVDVVVAAVALVLASPLMLAVAVAVRLELGRGVLFHQERVGLDGRPFQLLKFRSLRPERRGVRAGWSTVDTARMGPVGAFLRRSSLDELPQLWNVLRGQMSLVGPRPEQPQYVAQFASEQRGYPGRLRVPAGVTGWAQVHGLRGDTSLEDRVCFDNFYIEHWSLWQDVKILIRTVASVLRLHGG
jgi:exopolysaccharide biosynthesis polyprenyl glycosylphosphotransferase